MPVIMITGYDNEENRRRSKALGVVAYFCKPVDARALLDAIEFAGSNGCG